MTYGIYWFSFSLSHFSEILCNKKNRRKQEKKCFSRFSHRRCLFGINIWIFNDPIGFEAFFVFKLPIKAAVTETISHRHMKSELTIYFRSETMTNPIRWNGSNGFNFPFSFNEIQRSQCKWNQTKIPEPLKWVKRWKQIERFTAPATKTISAFIYHSIRRFGVYSCLNLFFVYLIGKYSFGWCDWCTFYFLNMLIAF